MSGKSHFRHHIQKSRNRFKEKWPRAEKSHFDFYVGGSKDRGALWRPNVHIETGIFLKLVILGGRPLWETVQAGDGRK
jgi:hypothetical protein